MKKCGFRAAAVNEKLKQDAEIEVIGGMHAMFVLYKNTVKHYTSTLIRFMGGRWSLTIWPAFFS